MSLPVALLVPPQQAAHQTQPLWLPTWPRRVLQAGDEQVLVKRSSKVKVPQGWPRTGTIKFDCEWWAWAWVSWRCARLLAPCTIPRRRLARTLHRHTG